MNSKDFEKELNALLKSISNKLGVKAREYRRNDNAFHNFETGELMSGQTKFRVLHGFLLKHLISYDDMLTDIDNNKYPTKEVVDEKLGDIINYFIIQKIMLENFIKRKKYK